MTREEAIRKLQKAKAEYLEEWVDFSGVAEAYDMAIEALEQPKWEWIPCSEMLPDGRLNKSYLVQDKDGRLAVGTYTNWGWMFGHYMNDPVAWMPLPKPYERKEE